MGDDLLAMRHMPQSVAKGKSGVASAHPLATEAGIACLEEGGNAYDALIAAAVTLVVVEPMMSGVLGCGLAMLHSPNQASQVCNFSGNVPADFSAVDWNQTRSAPLSIVTPETLMAWFDIHEQYGVLPFEQLFQPAIEYAEQGFRLTEANCYFLEFVKKSAPQNIEYDYYVSRDFQVGELFKQTKTAAALRCIVKNPKSALTSGDLADAMDVTLKSHQCALTVDDIKHSKPMWQSPLSLVVFGRRVEVPPPNSDAFVILQAAKLLEQSDIKSMEHNGMAYIDLVVGVLKRVLSESKGWGGDAEYVKSGFSPLKQNTTTIVAHDEQGNTAIMTQTLGGFFGSGVWVEEYGLPFNGIGSYFFNTDINLIDSRQTLAGRHVPVSISLVQVFDGDNLQYAFGTPGGFTIHQTELQVLLNILVFNMSLPEAIDAPRFFVDDRQDISIEGRVDSAIIAGLTDKGYKPKVLGDYSWMLGCMQGVTCGEPSVFVGDARRHAQAKAIF